MATKKKQKRRGKNTKTLGGNRSGRAGTVKRVFAAVGCLLLGAALGAAFKLSADYIRRAPAFNIREVKVSEGTHVQREDVLKLAGVRPGKNIFSFRLADAIQGVEYHPWIKNVSVRRQLPDCVLIEFEERTPIAIVAMESLYYIDENLEIFKKVVPSDDLDMTVITGISLKEVIDDSGMAKKDLKKAAQVLELASRSKVLPAGDISEIHVDGTLGIDVWTRTYAVNIKFGNAELKTSWPRLERVVVELDEDMEKVAVLDLNCKGRITAKLKQGYKLARDDSAMLLGQQAR